MLRQHNRDVVLPHLLDHFKTWVTTTQGLFTEKQRVLTSKSIRRYGQRRLRERDVHSRLTNI